MAYNITVSSFYVENFGCRATQADGAAIERELLDSGMVRAPVPAAAEVVVLNTCTVTASADQDVRATIRRIHRENPACRILVTGCYAQRAPGEIAALPGVSAVVGNSHKHQVASVASGLSPKTSGSAPAAAFVPLSALQTSFESPTRGPAGETPMRYTRAPAEILVGDIFAHTELIAAPVFEADAASDKTRPNLKVQDGCDNRCSFCIIPFVRGRSRSLKMEQVLARLTRWWPAGYREVVISRHQPGPLGTRLPTGAGESASKTWCASICCAHVRLETAAACSSVEPMDWSDELIDLMAVFAAHRQARARPLAVRQRPRLAADASQIPPLALRRDASEDSRGHARRRHRRRRHGRLPGRNRRPTSRRRGR